MATVFRDLVTNKKVFILWNYGHRFCLCVNRFNTEFPFLSKIVSFIVLLMLKVMHKNDIIVSLVRYNPVNKAKTTL